jgi:hypothetical protein
MFSMQLLPPPGWIKFVKQLRVPAAPFVSIPTALDFQPGRGDDGTGRKIEATAHCYFYSWDGGREKR